MSEEFEEDGPRELINSGARRDCFLSAMNEIDDLEGEIAERREKIKKIRHTKIKGELGMPIGEFNLLRKLKARQASEDGGFNSTIDALKEGFQILDLGVTLDWVEAMKQAEAA